MPVTVHSFARIPFDCWRFGEEGAKLPYWHYFGAVRPRTHFSG